MYARRYAAATLMHSAPTTGRFLQSCAEPEPAHPSATASRGALGSPVVAGLLQHGLVAGEGSVRARKAWQLREGVCQGGATARVATQRRRQAAATAPRSKEGAQRALA